jgi:hypothetical protein
MVILVSFLIDRLNNSRLGREDPALPLQQSIKK